MRDPLNAVVESTRKLNELIEEKAANIDKKVKDAQRSFESLADRLNIISGFEAVNYNADFIDLVEVKNSKGQKNVYPLRMGVGEGRNDCVKTEIIPVFSGYNPEDRDPEAQELLSLMKCNSKHFSHNFNILKMTITDPATLLGLERYDFFIPEQHVKRSPSATFMSYYKTVGDFSVDWLGNSGGVWDRHVTHMHSSSAGSYAHVDLKFRGSLKEGDILYIALPTICTGLFPKDYMHGNLYNTREKHIRRMHIKDSDESSSSSESNVG